MCISMRRRPSERSSMPNTRRPNANLHSESLLSNVLNLSKSIELSPRPVHKKATAIQVDDQRRVPVKEYQDVEHTIGVGFCREARPLIMLIHVGIPSLSGELLLGSPVTAKLPVYFHEVLA